MDKTQPATPPTANATQRAVDYLMRDETAGARDFREIAYMGATLGRAATTAYMAYRLAQALPAIAESVNYSEVYSRVFGALIARNPSREQ